MKNNIEQLLERATTEYGHKPSMAELTSFMLFERAAAGNSPVLATNDVEALQEHDCSLHESTINSTLEAAKNALGEDSRSIADGQEAGLFKNISDLEAQIAMKIMNAIQNGNIEHPEKLLTKAELKAYSNELAAYLAAYFTIVFPVYAGQVMANRLSEYSQQGIFAMTQDVDDYIRFSATNAADSHVETVVKDLSKAIVEAHNAQTEVSLVDYVEQAVRRQDKKTLRRLPQNPNREDIVEAVKAGKFDGDPIYKLARDSARQGNGLDAIVRELRKKYGDISKNRARTIARHETNRVFNMAQYQADLQFLTEAGLMETAYKRMYNRANDPCPFCAKIIAETNSNPIPFAQNFLDLGDTLTAAHQLANGKMSTRTMSVNYESIKAGNIHVNCRCEYELIIKREDGTFMNSVLDFNKVKNFNPFHDKKTGQFGSGGSGTATFTPKDLKDDEWGMSMYEEKYKASVTEEEAAVVTGYVFNPGSFNRLPRKDADTLKLPEEDRQTMLKRVAILDKAVNKSKLKDDLVLWRGSKAGDVFDNPADMKVGAVLTDDGFVSTSLSKTYARTEFTKDFLFKINAPKGSTGLVVNGNASTTEWSEDKKTMEKTFGSIMADEHEVLLPRGAAYKVKSVEKVQGLVQSEMGNGQVLRMITQVELDYIGTTK